MGTFRFKIIKYLIFGSEYMRMNQRCKIIYMMKIISLYLLDEYIV